MRKIDRVMKRKENVVQECDPGMHLEKEEIWREGRLENGTRQYNTIWMEFECPSTFRQKPFFFI